MNRAPPGQPHRLGRAGCGTLTTLTATTTKDPLMRDQTLGTYLDQLADRSPAPGGGAAAALHLAQAAALIAMVARFTTGPKYSDRVGTVDAIITAADQCRHAALELAAADADAFAAVAEAYKLPKDSDTAKAARTQAIASATAAAAQPPADTIATAARVVDLAEQLLPIGNPNVITDVAAAAEAARAAITTSRVNIEINLGGISHPAVRAHLTAVLDNVDALLVRTDQITATVRENLK